MARALLVEERIEEHGMLKVGTNGVANLLLAQDAAAARAAASQAGGKDSASDRGNEAAERSNGQQSPGRDDAATTANQTSVPTRATAKAKSSTAGEKSSKTAGRGDSSATAKFDATRKDSGKDASANAAKIAGVSFADVFAQVGRAQASDDAALLPTSQADGATVADLAPMTLLGVTVPALVASAAETNLASQTAAAVVPQAVTAVAPQAVTAVVPQAVTAVAPQGVTAVVPQGTAAVVPQAATAVVPQAATAVVPQGTTGLTSQAVAALALQTATTAAAKDGQAAVAKDGQAAVSEKPEPAASAPASQPAPVAVAPQTAGGGEQGTGLASGDEKSSGHRMDQRTAEATAKTRAAGVSETSPSAAIAEPDAAVSQAFMLNGGQGHAMAAAAHSAARADAVDPAAPATGQTAAESALQAVETPVADQIVQSLRGASLRVDHQLVVRLSPPDLGDVRVTLRTSGDQVRGVVEVSNPETFKRLEREAPALVSRLQDSGIQVQRLDVTLARQDSSPMQDNPMAQDGGRGQSQGGHEQHDSRAAPDTGRVAAEAVAQADTTAEAVPAGTQAINVRV
jgi:flagellar hook-length control protein FliK